MSSLSCFVDKNMLHILLARYGELFLYLSHTWRTSKTQSLSEGRCLWIVSVTFTGGL